MKMTNNFLYDANSDILFIAHNVKHIGWRTIKEQSIQRIMYLSKVLYSFTHNDDNIFDYYHFSITLHGPYSVLIRNSIINLKSNRFLNLNEGSLQAIRESPTGLESEKENWLKSIILILGKYGENRIFGFTINDPLYKEAVDTNSQRELDTSSPENTTIKVLNDFKAAFEETLSTTEQISPEEYLDLYFEYVFSQIINS